MNPPVHAAASLGPTPPAAPLHRSKGIAVKQGVQQGVRLPVMN